MAKRKFTTAAALMPAFPSDMRTASFVKDVRDAYHKDVDADRHNIEPARQDIQFVIGDQWDTATRRAANACASRC